MFRYVRIDTLMQPLGGGHCGCSFCKGGEVRGDVEHYKLFLGMDFPREYYLNIDLARKRMELVRKW